MQRCRAMLFAAIALGLALGMTGCGSETPEGEVKRYMKAMESGNASTMLSLMSPEQRKAYKNASSERKEFFREQVSRMAKAMREETKGIKSVKILERNINGDTARIKAETTFRNGDVTTSTLVLQRYGKDWCLPNLTM